MKARNITPQQLIEALARVNKTYKGNVQFDRFDPGSRSVSFTLRVADSRGLGARVGHSGRRLAKACWHVHGVFFDACLAIAPDCVIITRGGPGARVDKTGGNWQDCNIGSQSQPLYFSQACECNR